MAQIIDAILSLKDQFTPTLAGAKAGLNSFKATQASTSAAVQGHFGNMSKAATEHAGVHKRLAKTVEQTGKSFTELGTKTMIGAAALASVAAESVKLNQQLDTNIAKLQALQGTQELTNGGIAATRDEIYKTALELHVLPTDLSNAYLVARKNGIDMAAVQDTVTQSIKLSKASGVDYAETTKQVAEITKAYTLTSDDQKRVNEQLIATQTASKHSLEELQPALAALAPHAAAAGENFVNLSADVSYLTTNCHTTVPQAQAALEGFFSLAESGNARAGKAFASMGISIEQVQQTMKDRGGAAALAEIGQAAIDSGHATDGQLKKVLGSTELARMALQLASQDGQSNFKDLQNSIQNSGGLMDKYLKALGDTDAGKAKKAMTDMTTTAAQALAGLTPFLTRTAQAITAVMDYWNGLSSTTRGTILEILKYAVLGFAGLKILGSGFSAVSNGVKSVKNTAGTIKKIADGIKSIGSSFDIGSKLKGFLGIFKSGIGIAKTLFSVITNGILSVARTIVIAIASNPIILVIALIIALVVGAIYLIVTHWEQFKSAVSAIFKALVSVIKGYITAFVGFWTAVFETIANVVQIVVETVVNHFKLMAQFFNDIVHGDFAGALDTLAAMFGNVFSGIARVCDGVLQGIKSAINAVIGGINSVSVTIPDWVPGVGGETFAPNIPMLAKGTEYWTGGPAMIHDAGAEIVDLPTGSRVIPHDRSLQEAHDQGAREASGRAAGLVVNIPKIADTVVVRSEQDIDSIANKLAFKLQSYAINQVQGAL